MPTRLPVRVRLPVIPRGARGASRLAGEERAVGLACHDLVIAAGLALGFGALYALTFQTRTFGDGAGLVSMHVLGKREVHQHALFLPLCDWLQALLRLRDPFVVLRLVPVLGAAAGLGSGYLFLRSCGAERSGALVAIGLLAFSPVLWFFATTVHTQALQFGAVGCLALLTMRAPWGRPGLALSLVAAAFPVLMLTHMSAFLLGPGWVCLVQYARSRHGSRFTWPGLLLGVGPLLLAALVLGAILSFLMRDGSLASFPGYVRSQLAHEDRSDVADPTLRVLVSGWASPLGLLLPLGLAGCSRLRRAPGLALAIGFLVGIPTAFFLGWWGEMEKGGYFLASTLSLAVPVAALSGRMGAPGLALALVALGLQGALARRHIDTWDEGWDPASRIAQSRAAIGASGLLLSTTNLAPDIRCYLPFAEERSFVSFMQNVQRRLRIHAQPEDLLDPLRPHLDRLLEGNPKVCVDLAYRGIDECSPLMTATVRNMRAIEEYLRERYEVRDLPHPYWPMMVLERRR